MIFDQLQPPPPPAVAASGPNLRKVVFKAVPWRQRVLWPGLKYSALLVGAVGLLGLAGTSALAKYRDRQGQLALSHLAAAKGPKALEEAKRALALAGSSQNPQIIAQIHQFLGHLAEERSDAKTALAEYRMALQVSPDRSEARIALGKILRTQARIHWKAALVQAAANQIAEALQSSSRALQMFEEGQGSAREKADCHYLTASLYARMNLPDESRLALGQALFLDPKHTKARNLLAQLPAPQPKIKPAPRANPRRTGYPTWNQPYQGLPPAYYQPLPQYQPPNVPVYNRPDQPNFPAPNYPTASAPSYPSSSVPSYPSAYQPPAPVQSYPTYQPAYRAPAYPTGRR